MRNFKVNDLVLYKDMKGKVVLYKVLEVLNTSPVAYRIIQYTSEILAFPKPKNKKSFETTTRNKSGDKRLFKFWLEFGEQYFVYSEYQKNPNIGILATLENFYYTDGGDIVFVFVDSKKIIHSRNMGTLHTVSYTEKQTTEYEG